MLPSLSIVWLGSCTKLPGRTPASIGMNKPPAAASKIVTATVSPMPNSTGAGGRLPGRQPARTAGSFSFVRRAPVREGPCQNRGLIFDQCVGNLVVELHEGIGDRRSDSGADVS